MKLFRLTQEEHAGYDTYDSIIVCAKDKNDAKTISPYGDNSFEYGSWASCKENVLVEYLGEAKKGLKRGVILASFNAG